MDRLAFLTTLSVLFLAFSSASAAVCPQGWNSYGNFCYKFLFTSLTVRGKSWENAENTCQSFGGHLTSITNTSEQNFISNSIRKYKNDHFWIGYNDQVNESRFNWTDGTNPSIYKNWRWNEPNNLKNNEDCVELLFADGKWNDDDCKKEYGFICKIRLGVPIPTQPILQPPTTLTPLSCDAGWKHYGTSCYKFNLVRRKWVDARTDCHQSGGYLVKIEDSDEQHYITYTMKSMTQNMWIGLSDRAVEGIYVWEGDLTVAKNYTHWYSGEPNDRAGNEDCIATYSGFLAGYWNDDYCDSAKAYICEKPNSQNLCPINWVPYNNSCYQLNTHPLQSLNWQQAVNACRAIQGSDLVSIHSSGEQLFLTKQLNDLKSRNVWIGLNDVVKEGSFVWSDKSAYDYKNWGRYEPGSGWSGYYRDCSQLIVNSQNGTWGTSYCSNKNPYVCKMSRASMKCNAPFGLANQLIGDSQITASSSKDSNSPPSQARLRLQPTGSLTGAWCAANNQKGEYLQIDLGLNRRIGHIALQGRPKSTDFVRSFYITYGSDGLRFVTYGQNPKQNFKVLQGSVNADAVAHIMLDEKISGRFIRIYPQTWRNNICMRVEIYGCEGQDVLQRTQSLHLGKAGKIVLGALAYPLAKFKWKKDNVDIDFASESRLTLETDGSISISNVQESDVGIYDVNINWDGGRAIVDEKITVNVIEKPRFLSTPTPSKLTGVLGFDYQFCYNHTGLPKPTLKWYKVQGVNEVEVDVTNPRYSVDKNCMSIKTLQRSDAATYKCTSTNSAGSSSAGVSMEKVGVKPTVVAFAQDSLIKSVNKPLEIECNGQGDPLPTMQWTKGGNLVAGQTQEPGRSTMKFSKLRLEDTANYTCTAKNGLIYESKELTDSRDVQLNVIDKRSDDTKTYLILIIVFCVVLFLGIGSLTIYKWRRRILVNTVSDDEFLSAPSVAQDAHNALELITIVVLTKQTPGSPKFKL